MNKLSVYIPVSDNGSGSGKTGWAVDMMSAIASGAFNGRFIKIDELSGSHADRACNNMANRFLIETKCDVMLIIDIDTRLRPADVERIMGDIERGHKCVWGVYPKKQDDGTPCVNTWPTLEAPDANGLQNMRRSGRGFLAITRDVFEALKEDNGGPAKRFHNHGRVEWSFFHSGVVEGAYSAILPGFDEDGYPYREWITEDWMFCEDIRIHLGIPTLIDTGIVLKHVGEKTYSLPADALVRTDSNITSWRDIHGWFDYEDFYRFVVNDIPAGGTFVEVGSWLGRSMGAFAEFAKEADRAIFLHAVDTFQGKPENAQHRAILEAHGGSVEKAFTANMDALGVKRTTWIADSTSVGPFEDASCDAVFIDAAHDYESVLADIQAWWGKVKEGGIISGHDYDEVGVKEAVRVFFDPDEVQTMGRCWYVRV